MPPLARPPAAPFALLLLLTAALTAARVAALFATPLELYPDEAQYWLWSRELAWGYFSKPPMVGWLIAASTAAGGDEEAWIRLPAALAHAAAALAVFTAGARLYDGWSGFWAAVIYSLAPGIQLSALVMSTDAPLLLFLAIALACYVLLWRGPPRSRTAAAGAFGLALGLAFLSKYAAIYFIIGAAAHALTCRDARRAWSPAALIATVLAFVLAAAPNLAWNAANGFSTLSHTAAETNWDDPDVFSLAGLADFVAAQFVVFGPAPFALLLGGGAYLAVRRRLREEDRALLLFAAVPLAVVAVQAFVSGSNANWAAAAYVPGAVLLGAWLVRWRARRLLGATVVLQGVLGAAFLVLVVEPALADRLGAGNGFKRARGWSGTAAEVARRAESGDWSAVTADNRFLYNALAYYGRETLTRPGAPPLTTWVRGETAQTHAEATAPLTAALGRRVLVASIVADYRPLMARDFLAWRPLGAVEVRLDPERTREVAFYEAAGYRRAPRDPVTGRPTGS